MRVFNLIENPQLWNEKEIFSNIQNFDKKFGTLTADQIIQYLNLSKNTDFDNEDFSLINQQAAKAIGFLSEDFSTDSFALIIAGLSSSADLIIKEVNGVSGYSYFNTSIVYLSKLGQNWRNALLYTAVHELNHLARMSYYGIKKTYLDYLIFEGLADNFVLEKTGIQTPWSIYSAKDVDKYFNEVKSIWYSLTFEEMGDWMFDNKDRNIPWCLGYAMGFKMVKEFRDRNPDLSWPDLIKIPSEEFIK